MGEVAVLGTYTLTSFAAIFHAIYSAGGINKIGGHRVIKVNRGDKQVANTDVYDFLLKGESSEDIALRGGILVKVEPYRRMLRIKLEVKIPLYYEMKEGETIKSLIDFAGGFKGEAYKKNLLVERKGASELKVFTVTENNYS
jgi:protein involved in polysaccharide export with SLBB domain